MDNVNSSFHNLVTDGVTEQCLFLIECSGNGSPFLNFYFSGDGDMTVDGATFTDELTSGDNYGLGCIPSRTMSVALMNEDGHLNGHSYGWISAHIGVSTNHTDLTPVSGVYASLAYQGEEQSWDGLYECRTTGFYRDNTLVYAGDCTGAFTAGDGYFYFILIENGSPVAYEYDTVADTTHALSDTALGNSVTDDFLNKFAEGRIVVLDLYNRMLIDVHTDYSDTYSLANMGHFRVDKPSKTMGKTVNISDAFDMIRELDVDASSFLTASTVTNGWDLFYDIYQYFHIEYVFSNGCIRSRLEALPVNITELAKNSYTFRKLLSYLFEAVGCNARLKTREGYQDDPGLYIYLPYDEKRPMSYPIGAARIAAGSLEIQEYVSHAVDRVSVKSLDGETTMYPSVGDYCYTYDGNPFTSKANNTLFGYVRQIPQYQPMTFSLLEADPSFQVGDLITVEVSYGDEVEIADYFGRIITDYALDIITITPSEGKWIIPLMAQRITWNGKTSAEYEAKGSEDRSGYVSGGDYTDVNARTAKITNVSELNNDAGYLTLATLPIYGADVQIVYDGEVS